MKNNEDILPDHDLNTGNRGIIEVNSKSKKLNHLISLIAIIVILVISFFFISKLLNSDDIPQTGIEKKNEALEHKQTDDRSVTARMKEIADLQEQEKQRKLAEAQRNAAAAEVDNSGGLTDESNTDTTTTALESIKAQTDDDSASQKTGTGDIQDKEQLPPKKWRILTGDTVIDVQKSASSSPAKSQEKDFLQGGTYQDGKASVIRNRDFLLPAGTSLSCVLKTKIVTSYPGFTMCQLTKDVYSDNGHILLIRKGARLVGEQKQAIQQGIARVFVNWTTITDGKASIRIDALGADGLGASGLPAWIDSHFWQRFGGALMLSFIDDALDTVKNLADNKNNQGYISYDNSSSGTQKMAETVLQNSINIPPTAYVNQGTVLTVIVPRSVDFSDIYQAR